MKKKIKQINNLVIYQISDCNYRYGIFTLNKIFLEQFRYLSDAELFCRTTKDFIKNQKG